MKPKGGRRHSIPCPVCNSKTREVFDTRAIYDGVPGKCAIRRRVECANGHRYTTYERPAWAWQENGAMEETIRQLKELVRKL